MSRTTPPPCGLTPTEGIPLVAQAVLHRELLHVHASLAHIHTLLQQPLALRSPPLLDRVAHPHLRVNHTTIHYTHELLTAMGLLHILHHSPEQLEAELQSRTAFADRLPPSTTSTIVTVDGITVFEGRPHHTFPSRDPLLPPITTPPSNTRAGGTSVRDPPSAGPAPRNDSTRSRSRSRPRLTPS